MTDEELEELIADSPTLFHMAELGSWPSIRERGLLSTTALLDLYGVSGSKRAKIEKERRPESVTLKAPGLPDAVIRDNIPMTDEALKRCLPDHLGPSNWYELLNKKVFFWLTRKRLHVFLSAGAYHDKSHDVLEVDSRLLIEGYRDSIWLTPMNTGNTKPFPHPRDENTFRRIPDYPYAQRKKKRLERVVELAVDHGIPDIKKFVTGVTEMRGTTIIRSVK